jgi:hypothetical protein
VKSKDLSALPSAKIRFVEPMYAQPVQHLPGGRKWRYEIKFDGYRCLSGKSQGGVSLWSRRKNLLTKQFPHIARACEQLRSGILIDGEIVALDENEKEIKIEAEGLLAVALQHEIDHLDGKLFIDRISRLKRDLYTRKRKKMLRTGTPPPRENPRVMI